jgi:hypothetical protein
MNMDVDSADNGLPLIELLKTQIVDRKTGERTTGMVGNNFSSYVRDYDFSVLLWGTIKTSLRSARQNTLENCTESYSSTSSAQQPIKRTLPSSLSSA